MKTERWENKTWRKKETIFQQEKIKEKREKGKIKGEMGGKRQSGG